MAPTDHNDDHDVGGEAKDLGWQPIDLLLNQGSTEEVAAMREEVSRDPMLALDLADTVGVVEQFRHLRTDASQEFAGKLQDVTNVAERFYRSHYQPKASGWRMPAVMTLAAAATLSLLWWLDAAKLIRKPASNVVAELDSITINDPVQPPPDGTGSDPVEVLVTSEQALWESTVEEIARRLGRGPTRHMQEAFETGIEDAGDPLEGWVDPSNTVRLLRLEHELRASAEVRAEALRTKGALAEVDDRVQELADDVAASLMHELNRNPSGVGSVAEDRDRLQRVATGVRALIAAGPQMNRVAALRHGGDWLARRLPDLEGERLVIALSGLLEVAAVNGAHFEEVARAGRRLVDGVLKPDGERWRRSLPELLTSRPSAGSLGDAGRILARLPAFGVDPAPCKLVRLLLLGQLRERRALQQDRPEVLAAMLYGCGDLLASAGKENEQARIVWALRRWKPARLAPDFTTVQQIAWAQQPGSLGYTRLQYELRQLAVLPSPADLRNRAAFCLCLATNYAGHVGAMVSASEGVRPL